MSTVGLQKDMNDIFDEDTFQLQIKATICNFGESRGNQSNQGVKH